MIWTVKARANREIVLGIVNESNVNTALDAAHERYGWVSNRSGNQTPRPVVVELGQTQLVIDWRTYPEEEAK